MHFSVIPPLFLLTVSPVSAPPPTGISSPLPLPVEQPRATMPVTIRHPEEDQLNDLLADAERFFKAGEYTRAREHFTQALTIDSSSSLALNGMGLCYFHLEQREKAILFFKKAINADPGLSAAYYNLGRCYAAKKQWELAITYYDKAIEDNPALASAYFDKGTACFLKKDFSKAREAYECAAELFGLQTPRGEEALKNAIKIEMLIERRGISPIPPGR